MSWYGTIALVFAVLAGEASRAETANNDLEKLQGTWLMVSHVADGELNEVLSGALRVVDGKEFEIMKNDQVLRGARIKLDPTKQPKWIDITFTKGPEAGKVRRGIYVLVRDTQQICYGELSGTRPAQFVSKPGTGHRLVVFHRVRK